ncbi:vanadium-dependent haloperoxidase [Actinoplanes subtropicus]|uniref:vanadium-dependent haloperoxidase n=1 Tax=Actinoplanes subtropicus TaxID=543632 RepID=UPI001FDEF498|nr:vanadium-dependent haloperoxidase [Actinoplanes subtropicus]
MRRRSVLLLAGGGVGILATGVSPAAPASAGRPASVGGQASTSRQASAGRSASGDLILDWNAALLRIVRTAGAQPPTIHPTRSFAMLHKAMDNAVVAAPGAATAGAAAAAAGHGVLVALHPASTGQLDDLFQSQLAALPAGPGRAAGERTGRAIALAMVRSRAADGSGATPPVLPPGTAPGEYRPTPPAFAAPVFTHWAGVRPFVLRSAGQFGVAPYPRLTGDTYAAALEEVRMAGRDAGSNRTPDQTEMARFWAAPIWNYWNEIAAELVRNTGAGLHRAAAVFAELNLAIADSVIAFYAAKYAHRIWRPVTAIRLADTDHNPATTADPAWNPLATTPADPSYPGAHSVVSQAAALVLRRTLGDRPAAVTSEALPGVTRTFRHLQDVADEAGLSRIFAGVHTRIDHWAGQHLGFNVGRYALAHATAHGRPLAAA